jgi:hypothetical protein
MVNTRAAFATRPDGSAAIITGRECFSGYVAVSGLLLTSATCNILCSNGDTDTCPSGCVCRCGPRARLGGRREGGEGGLRPFCPHAALRCWERRLLAERSPVGSPLLASCLSACLFPPLSHAPPPPAPRRRPCRTAFINGTAVSPLAPLELITTTLNALLGAPPPPPPAPAAELMAVDAAAAALPELGEPLAAADLIEADAPTASAAALPPVPPSPYGTATEVGGLPRICLTPARCTAGWACPSVQHRRCVAGGRLPSPALAAHAHTLGPTASVALLRRRPLQGGRLPRQPARAQALHLGLPEPRHAAAQGALLPLRQTLRGAWQGGGELARRRLPAQRQCVAPAARLAASAQPAAHALDFRIPRPRVCPTAGLRAHRQRLPGAPL